MLGNSPTLGSISRGTAISTKNKGFPLRKRSTNALIHNQLHMLLNLLM